MRNRPAPLFPWLAAVLVLLVPGLARAAENACTVAGQSAGGGGDAFTNALSKGPVYAGGAALLGGLLVSLTPCVYPMIAVTVSVFGARESKSRVQGMMLSLAFVLGIIAMFVPLGVVAGLTGGVFGTVLQNQWVIVGISVLFLVMAASMFGAFDLALPASITNRLATVGGIGYKGAFVLGLVCGLIAAPCTGPVLTGILTWIAKTQSAALGAMAMAAFALGLGAPFFVVGAFAVQLPKSGRWMIHVKSLLGIVLVVVALYFLSTAFPALGALAKGDTVYLVAAAVAVVIGLLLGAVHRSFDEPGPGIKVRKGVGTVLTSVGAFLVILGFGKPAQSLSWEHVDWKEAQAKASREKRPLLVDFTATWCGACKQLERETFSKPEVAQEAGRFVAVKVDATDDEDPQVTAAMQSMKVVGLPTVLVYDSSGNEAVRCTDFVPAGPFLDAIKRVD
ncbi:MAG: cytochrome c biogenesis protein CcdA [Polyangiaceae bacterium]